MHEHTHTHSLILTLTLTLTLTHSLSLSLSLSPSLPPSQLLMKDKVQCKITKLPVHTPDVMEKVTDIMATLQSVAQCNLFL